MSTPLGVASSSWWVLARRGSRSVMDALELQEPGGGGVLFPARPSCHLPKGYPHGVSEALLRPPFHLKDPDDDPMRLGVPHRI